MNYDSKPNLRTRLGAAQWILNAEARRDKEGRLRIYRLPKGDGGGTFEVAGLNDRYHPQEAEHAAALIRRGEHAKAEDYVRDVIAQYTDPAERWAWESHAIEFFLRDCVWNRGPRGAGKILQLSLGFRGKDVDGWVGRQTIDAMRPFFVGDQAEWVRKLRAARFEYEMRIAPPVGERAKFLKGLLNRFDAAEEAALSIV